MKKIIITAVICLGIAIAGSSYAIVFYSPRMEIPYEKPVVVEEPIIEKEVEELIVNTPPVKILTVEERLTAIELRLDKLEAR